MLACALVVAPTQGCQSGEGISRMTSPEPNSTQAVSGSAALTSSANLVLQVTEYVDSTPTQNLLGYWVQIPPTSSLILAVSTEQDIAICPPSITRYLPFTIFDIDGSPGTAVFDIAPTPQARTTPT